MFLSYQSILQSPLVPLGPLGPLVQVGPPGVQFEAPRCEDKT